MQAPEAFEREQPAQGPERQRMQRREDACCNGRRRVVRGSGAARVARLAPQQREPRTNGQRPRERTHARQRRFVRIERAQREQRQHRRERERGPFGERPCEPAARGVREPRGTGREQCGRIDDEAIGMQVDVAACVDQDLVQPAADPPQQPPRGGRDADLGHPCVPCARFAAPVQPPAGEQAGERDQQHRDGRAVEHRQRGRVGRREQAREERACRGELHQQPEAECEQAFLAHAEPHDGRAFDGPRGAGRRPRERERYRERREDDREREHRFEQQPEAVAAPREPCGDRDVERRQRDRAPRERERHAFHERRLQRGRDDRRAEHERAVHVVPQREFAFHRIQQRDTDIHQEEQDEERLGAREQRGAIGRHAPRGADREREHEAEQVQRAPGLEPRDRENARVQQCVVAEQRDMVALAGRQQDRCEEAARAAHERERQRVLPHREERAQRADRDHQRERGADGQQRIKLGRGEDRQVQDADAAALQHETVCGAARSHAPADREQRGRGERRACEAEFDRQHVVVGRVLEQERDAEEQHDDPDTHDRVAAEQPVARGAERAFGDAGFARRRRFGWGRAARGGGRAGGGVGVSGCRGGACRGCRCGGRCGCRRRSRCRCVDRCGGRLLRGRGRNVGR